MIPINQPAPSTSSCEQTGVCVEKVSPKKSVVVAFEADTVKRMFPCLDTASADNVNLCCLYLNGTSDLFAEDFSPSDGSGASSPLDGPCSSTACSTPTKRSSVKRRKNCKLNHKVDGNLNKAENESEESMHFFPNDEKDISSEQLKKPVQLSQQQQFDGTLTTLGGHLLALQEEVDRVGSVPLVSTEGENGQENEQPTCSNRAPQLATGSRLTSNESILSLLQQIFRDLNKVKRFLTFKTANRRKGSQDESNADKAAAGSTSPSVAVSSPSLYNSNVERLLRNRMFVLQLLHLECTILRYLRKLEATLLMDAGAILSADECSALQLRLEELLRSYYMLLTKLSYEPTFLKIISLVHRSTPMNGACLLLIIFRSLVLREGVSEGSGTHPKRDDAPAMQAGLEEEAEKIILSVEHDEENREHDVKMVESSSSAGRWMVSPTENKTSISNNRTVVLMLSFLQGLAKEEIFASQSTSDASSDAISATLIAPKKTTSLVAVCHELLLYLCHDVNTDGLPQKSVVRQHAIETVALLCLTKRGLFDAIQLGSALLQTLLTMVSRCAGMHTGLVSRQAFLYKSATSKDRNSGCNANKPSFTEQKMYIAILRDIYGLLSILISLTEYKSGREYLLFHNVSTKLYEMFMAPFVEMLNGTEAGDPEHLISTSSQAATEMRISDRSVAYMMLRGFFNSNQKMQRYLDRIIGISSIIVQRLLDPMPIPLEYAQNPYTFNLPVQLPTESCHLEAQLNDENANDATLPVELNDDAEKKHFEAFDSDLEEDDNDDDDDSEDDEDSLLQNGDSSTEQAAAAADDSLDFTRFAGSKSSAKGEDQENVLLPYLRFFPEIQHFNWNNVKTEERAYLDEILACSCDVDVERFLTRHNFDQTALSGANSIPPAQPFNWKECYEIESRSTASVMPCLSLPLPDLNFLNAPGDRNELPQPMTYPFLDRAIQRKNYHHIKMLDHVRERLQCRTKPSYHVVYDIENLNQTHVDGGLQFDSKFECGNLRKVLVRQQHTPNSRAEEEEYLLLLNTDINSSIHTQWFYFSVRGMKPNKRYRFKVINLQKKSILYNSGQQPVYYSKREFEEARKMWQRIGVNEKSGNIVAYYRNHFVRGSSVANLFSDKPFYTLEFTFVFPYEDDVCYFSYNVPFSYTFLKTTLAYWQDAVQQHNESRADPNEAIFFRRQTLCCSLKGNDLPVLTITSNTNTTRPHYVLISARVHPSESNSSWIMKGFVDFLLHQSTDPANEQLRQKLLKNYVFKVIPMLNPDGVINGCTRTDLQRDDLNRQWHNPHPLLHPTIYHSRMVLRCLDYFSSGRNPVAFIDLHGHSRRKNIFSYSCSPMLSWKKSDRGAHRKKTLQNHFCLCPPKTISTCQLRAQMKQLKDMGHDKVDTATGQENGFFLMPPFVTLPVLLQLQRAPCFNLENCSFVVQRDREHTARVVGWREFEIPLSYTIECTASGCDVGPYAGHHLTINQLEEMGQYIASSFGYLDFLNCTYRHVPVIVMPKSAASSVTAQQTISPIRHPGNDDFLKNLLDKCTKRYRRPNGDQNRFQIRNLLQLYPDLNMLSASMASSSSSTSLSSVDSLPFSQPASPSHATATNPSTASN